MSEISILMEKGWVTKADPDFYDIKSYMRKNKDEISMLLMKFGWRLVTEPNYVSIKKYKTIDEMVPDQGLSILKSKQDYLNLMIFLMFMSQPSHNTVFTLEEAMDYLKMVVNEEKMLTDVTSRHFAYSVYRTLTYMESTCLLERLDGKLNDLISTEIKMPGILYKNTGMHQHYLERIRKREKAGLQQEIYQKLYGKMITEISDKEWEYLRKHQAEIENDFKTICDEDVELIFGKGYAYINHKEGFHFPNENNRKDWMILRVLGKLKECDQDIITRDYFRRLLEKVRNEDSLYWTQEMIKWGNRSYESFVTDQLKRKNMIKEVGEDLKIHPAIKNMDL